jgi:lipoprotein-releasing system ATP-binding protein
LLADVGLADRESHKPRALSGGEQQRVAVARALVNQPLVLLADEPSGNLDTETGRRLHDVLFDLRERHRLSIVIVTHDLDLAARADRRLVLEAGRLLPGTSG